MGLVTGCEIENIYSNVAASFRTACRPNDVHPESVEGPRCKSYACLSMRTPRNDLGGYRLFELATSSDANHPDPGLGLDERTECTHGNQDGC